MSPTIQIDRDTFSRLQLAARVAGISISEAVRRLAFGPTDMSETTAPEAVDEAEERDEKLQTSWVKVFKEYKRTRVDAELDLESGRMRITSGAALDGNTYGTPSAAAIAVVEAVSPDRGSPETNGWRFWKDSKTGNRIDRAFPEAYRRCTHR